MSHFYGTIKGGRGQATRTGHKTSGLTTHAASWHGAISVELWRDDDSSADMFRVVMVPWHGAGDSQTLCVGRVGDFDSVEHCWLYPDTPKAQGLIEAIS